MFIDNSVTPKKNQELLKTRKIIIGNRQQPYKEPIIYLYTWQSTCLRQIKDTFSLLNLFTKLPVV